MSETIRKTAVFTDIDGTLINDRYESGKNFELIKKLCDSGITVFYVSSRTFKELEHLNKISGLNCPFIGENGNFIYLTDKNEYMKMGISKNKFSVFTEQIQNEFSDCIVNIENLGIKKFAELSGYSLEDAERGFSREYSVLFKQISDNTERINELKKKCCEKNLILQFGGKWLSLSAGSDKGAAIKKVNMIYKPDITFGIGNSDNDYPMLEIVDRPYAVINENFQFCEKLEKINGITKINKPAPDGWQLFFDDIYFSIF